MPIAKIHPANHNLKFTAILILSNLTRNTFTINNIIKHSKIKSYQPTLAATKNGKINQ